MEKKSLFALTAVGLVAAIAVPTIAFGNARNNTGGTHAAFHASQTPLVGLMDGPSDLTTTGIITPTGDTDGTGAAAFTFDIANATDATDAGAQVCWDITWSNIDLPVTAVHIHTGAAGVGGGIVVPAGVTFPNITNTGTTGCLGMSGVLATQIVATPANFYVNVHNGLFPGGAIRSQLSTGSAAAGEAHLLPTPLRVYDSRDAAGPKIQPGETRTISLTSGHLLNSTVKALAVPPGATAALITLTVADTDLPGGFLTVYNADSGQPATSSINWKAAAQDIAVGTQVGVNAAGQIKVTDGVGTAPTHFIIDVVGFVY